MNEEAYFRDELRRFRRIATLLQRVVMNEAIYATPTVQAEMIIKGLDYWLPSQLLVRLMLITGELKDEQKQEKIAEAEKLLRAKFGPTEITREVTLPLVKTWLESLEHYALKKRYWLPAWERPEWFLEMENKSKLSGRG